MVQLKANPNNPINIDVAALRGTISAQALQKSFMDALIQFMKIAGIPDRRLIQFRLSDGSTLSCDDFIKCVVKANNTSAITALKQLCKDTNYMNEIISIAGENNLKAKKGETRLEAFQMITIDPSRARKNVKESNVAFGNVPVVNQNVNKFSEGVKQLNSSSFANQYETRLVYKEEWVINLLKGWGYFGRA